MGRKDSRASVTPTIDGEAKPVMGMSISRLYQWVGTVIVRGIISAGINNEFYVFSEVLFLFFVVSTKRTTFAPQLRLVP